MWICNVKRGRDIVPERTGALKFSAYLGKTQLLYDGLKSAVSETLTSAKTIFS